MVAKAIGIVSSDCETCDRLKESLVREFKKHEIELEFVIFDTSVDFSSAMETSLKLGLNDIPSFLIGGVVFRSFFDARQINDAVKAIKSS